jgi:hypothetical protein
MVIGFYGGHARDRHFMRPAGSRPKEVHSTLGVRLQADSTFEVGLVAMSALR